MVITVTCPSCSSSFPVDSDKVPAKGVNARCSTCGDVFRIEKPAEGVTPPAPPTVPEPEVAPAPPATSPKPTFYDEPTPEETASSLEEVNVMPPPSVPEMPPPSVPETPAGPAESESGAETASESEPAAPAADAGFRFGKRDPTDKAKRLARVLVSDMIMYNADRHATALEAGTLKEDFEDEIDKSWKEFVEQVGSEMAEGPGRGFWTEALNDILAKGEQLF
ncbi:MAG: zinc-ribbon domain-containing protein [Gemmatimonadota bacterium]|jgi:predicted Zn finger-like uncharacterized protein